MKNDIVSVSFVPHITLDNNKYSDYSQLSQKVFSGLDLSTSTIKDYQYRIGQFLEYLNRNGFNHNTLLDYKRYLQGLNYSVSTKNKYFISAKIFLRELYRLDYLSKDVTVNIKGFKQNHNHKKDGLNDDDISLIQNHCKSLPLTSENSRLKAIISLLLFQGLRQIEVSRLDVKDVDLQNKCAFIRGKSRDDKELIWLHPFTVKSIKDYLKSAKIYEGALFRSNSNFCKNHRLTTKSIRVILKALLDDLGIDGSTHGFRHFFTTKLIKSYKGELLTVSKYTRHRSIQMLEVYNDEVIRQEDLPRFYSVFNELKF